MQRVADSGERVAPEGGLPVRRLEQATHEFEGQMLKQLLKPMTESDGLTGDEDSNCLGCTGGVLGEFASEALGQAISLKGGLGIADEILTQLARFGGSDHSRNFKPEPESEPT